MNDIASQIADNVEAAVNATNALSVADRVLTFHYNRQSPKRRRLITPVSLDSSASAMSDISTTSISEKLFDSQGKTMEHEITGEKSGSINIASDTDKGPASLSKMVAVLCEQQLFSPLLRAFDMFLPSCPLLPFIRALQVWQLIQSLFGLFNILEISEYYFLLIGSHCRTQGCFLMCVTVHF